MGHNGSPLDARLNSFVYIFILIVCLASFVLAVIYFFILKRRASSKSKRWADANRNRETKQSDVQLLSSEAFLEPNEKKYLFELCKRNRAKNIYFLWREEEDLSNLFRKEFDYLSSRKTRDEGRLDLFFSVRYKLEKLYDRKHSINSTKQLEVGQKITIVDEKEFQIKTVLEKNTPLGFYVSIPHEFDLNKPKPLSKFMITFAAETGILYQCETRAVRYEETISGKEFLLLSHSTSLELVQKRATKRMNISTPCLFSAVKITGNDKKKKFEIQSQKHEGKFIDISAGGCKFSCSLPIVKDQYLQLYFDLPGLGEQEAQGLILKTKKTDEKTFVLYIKFTDIDIKVKNNIYTKIYGYI